MVRRCEYEDTQHGWALVCGNSLFVSRKELSACGSREPPKPCGQLPLSAGVFVFGVALAAAARRFEGEILKKIKKFQKSALKRLTGSPENAII